MKVLAQRANGWIFVAPFIFIPDDVMEIDLYPAGILFTVRAMSAPAFGK